MAIVRWVLFLHPPEGRATVWGVLGFLLLELCILAISFFVLVGLAFAADGLTGSSLTTYTIVAAASLVVMVLIQASMLFGLARRIWYLLAGPRP